VARIHQEYDPAVPVASLSEHPDNPRRGNVDAIDGSMRIHGFYGAVLAQLHTGRIVAGNHRYRVAVERGEDTLPVIWLDVDDDQARRILLADNRTGDLGDYSPETLEALLRELLVETDLGLAGTGYSVQDLARLFGSPEPEPGLSDPDDAPEAPLVPRSKPGDLWLLGPHRILCGDSTSADDVKRLMDGERAQLMATDPPYLVDYDGSNHPQSRVNSAMTKDKEWDDYVDPTTGAAFFTAFLGVGIEHALVERAPIYQWHADMRRGLVLEAWAANGLLAHQTVIWSKARPVLTRSDFMWSHEPCLYGWVKGMRPETERRPPANERTVWEIAQQGSCNDIHPTQKPTELFERPIGWHTLTGEVCFEPFSGSGSQIIAAQRLGRRCFAMELAPQYVDVACRRFQEHTGVLPVLEATGEATDFTGG
jgi:DNA modification methylase